MKVNRQILEQQLEENVQNFEQLLADNYAQSKNRQILEQQLADYEAQSKRLHSFVHELKATTTKHGTDQGHFWTDLLEAENDATYYDGEISRLKKELAQAPSPGAPGSGSILPQTPKQGIGSLIFSSITFVAGALLGSKFRSRKNKE